MVRVKAIALAALLGGCLPLTFAHEGQLDFTTYTEVNVAEVALRAPDLGVPDEVSQPTLAIYLVDALRNSSGFKVVTSTKESAQTQLIVSMRLERTNAGLATDSDDRVEGIAEFKLLNRSGTVLAVGEVTTTGDDDDIPGVQQELLDDVAYYFLRPYRI